MTKITVSPLSPHTAWETAPPEPWPDRSGDLSLPGQQRRFEETHVHLNALPRAERDRLMRRLPTDPGGAAALLILHRR